MNYVILSTMYRLRQGVSGFIYTSDNVKHFDDNEDTIEEYLSDWYHDTLSVDNYMREICNDTNPCSFKNSRVICMAVC